MTPTPEPVTPSPSPSKTPRGRRTPRGGKKATPTPVTIQQVDPLQEALRQKAELTNARIPRKSAADLAALASQSNVQKVVIDPDDGNLLTSSKGNEVSALTLAIAQKLQAVLQSKGIEAVLTRSTADPVSFGKKLELINSSGAQLMISVRVGESDFAEVSGYRILYVGDSVDYNATHRTREGEDTSLVPPDLNYMRFSEKNKMFGSALLSSLKRLLQEDAIGVNPSPLFLAKRAPMTSALVIVGYITNSRDAGRLLDGDKQQQLAEALAEGIAQFGRSSGLPAPSGVAAAGVRP